MTKFSIDEICAHLRRVWNDDQMYEAMSNGSMQWGDIVPLETPSTELEPMETPSATTTSDETAAAPVKAKMVESWTRIGKDTVVRKLEFVEERHVPTGKFGIKTLIVRNLPRDISTDLLMVSFMKYGPIRDIYIPRNMDKSSQYYGTVKGFALIKFLNATDSATAYTKEFGILAIRGQKIFIEFAKEDR